MSTRHMRGLVLAHLLPGPKTASQIVDRMRAADTRWPTATGDVPVTYTHVMSALVATSPECCERTGHTGQRGATWRLTDAGRARAAKAIADQAMVDEAGWAAIA